MQTCDPAILKHALAEIFNIQVFLKDWAMNFNYT